MAAALIVLVCPSSHAWAQSESAKPIEPVVVSMLSGNPDAYYGRSVSLAGFVAERLSGSAWLVQQDASSGTAARILILTPPLTGPVVVHARVTVLGEVVRLDPAALARWSTTDAPVLPPEIVEKYRGTPTVLATAVIDAAGAELIKERAPRSGKTSAAAEADPLGRLTCVFHLATSGSWVKGEPKVRIDAATLSLAFDAIDVNDGTARAIGEFSTSDIIVKASEGGRHFLQVFRSGPIYLTTVFDADVPGRKMRAVHTRHEASGISQYFGECEAVRSLP